MAGSFSARLAELRKKRGISQKQAASALGISQALLSHYEKGIRECSLDFVKKAAKYYDVTCDYLLGMTNSKKSISVDFDEGDESQDGELTISTIYRAATILEKTLSKRPSDSNITKDFLAVGLYRIISAAAISGDISPDLLGFSPEFSSALADVQSARILKQIISGKSSKQKPSDKTPLCIKTVVSAAEKNLSESIKNLNPESK
jgi:transcriptional regulator with XRE-family HTH domain